MRTEQRLFNEALIHIRKQRCQSANEGTGNCQYRIERGEQTLGCAFAPAIEKYTPSLEGASATVLLISYSNQLYEWVRNCNQGFAYSLQRCHDSNMEITDDRFMQYFEKDMKDLAEKYNLEYKEENES